MHELAARDDVIALAFHVDYWDYLFDDVFGKPAHTERQYGYANTGGRRMVYTPQMIINGRDEIVGNRPEDVKQLITRSLSAPQTVSLAAERSGGDIVINAQALTGATRSLLVQVVRFIPRQTVAINGGENSGHEFTYANIVTDIQEIGRWQTGSPLSLRVATQGSAPMVVILQRPGFGPVEAAALVH